MWKSLIDQIPPSTDGWGPSPSSDETIDGVPYAPFSKGDKLGRIADWGEGKDRDRGGRQNFGNRGYRENQIYGSQTAPFAIQAVEDESSFSVVDNTRTSTRTRPFGRGGNNFSRGGRGQRGNQAQRGRGTYQRVGGRPPQQNYDNRNVRGGRGGRRFGYNNDRPQRNRDASIQVEQDWILLEEIDFLRLNKLRLDIAEGQDLETCGFLHHFDYEYDKPLGVKLSEKKLEILDRVVYNITTSSDPIISRLASQNEATVFATDSILSALMCTPKSIYSWDLRITKQDGKIFIDKREGTSLDSVTVNENASEPPLETSEGNKDTINSPGALMQEATHINHVFQFQVVKESEKYKKTMDHDNPFYDPDQETSPLASKAYRYRKFNLSPTQADADDALNLVVRTEIDAIDFNKTTKEEQYLTIRALNEFDSKAPGSSGSLDWRLKLASQRGAVLATEMKNNNFKLARWTVQSLLAKADFLKLGFVSRVNPRMNNEHMILGVMRYKPREFATQMNLSMSNGWGIVRAIIDIVLRKEDGIFVLVKDPNKNVIRLYSVPPGTFDEDEGVMELPEENEDEEAEE